MNTFTKIGGDWCVACASAYEPGETVTVTLRSGGTKQVTLGERVGLLNGRSVYAAAPAPAKPTVAIGNLTGVLALFDRAAQKIKFPAIVLYVPELGEVRLSVAGGQARVPGSLNVVTNARREWLGRITRDGAFQPARTTHAELVPALRDFADKPAEVAAAHGRLTGKCCFCNTGLDDERSVAVGYGPTCAKNYGLAWGKAAAVAQGPSLFEAVAA